MKYLSCAALAIALLAGCSGGGGGGSNSGGSGGYTPNGPIVYNTANIHYVPLASGNSWTFATGGRILDAGTYSLTCVCGVNGQTVEDVDLYDPQGTYSGTFILAKTTGTPQSTTLLGISSNHGTAITLLFTGTSYGLPFMDDAPSIGQGATVGGETTTITNVGGTQPYSNGIINNVATDTITGASLDMAWSFARGVGFAAISEGGQSTQLVAFSIDPIRSQSLVQTPRVNAITGSASPALAAAALKAILGS